MANLPGLDRLGIRPATRATRYATTRWLATHGHADLLPVLGLEVEATRLAAAARRLVAAAQPSAADDPHPGQATTL